LHPAFEIKKDDLYENGLEANQYFHHYFLVLGTSSQFKHTSKHTYLIKNIKRNGKEILILRPYSYTTPQTTTLENEGDLKLKKKKIKIVLKDMHH
jgi:hypothetical protein